MDPVEDGQQAVDAAMEVIEAVTPADLDRPTPCAAWDVRALVGHMIDMCEFFTSSLQVVTGRPVEGVPAALAPDTPDLAARYRAAAAAVMGAWRTPGWADATLALPFGELPAEVAVRVFVGDQLIHSWDLATAIGRPFAMPEAAAEVQLQMMRDYYHPEARGPDRPFDLAQPCPPTGSVQDQLIALSGRAL